MEIRLYASRKKLVNRINMLRGAQVDLSSIETNFAFEWLRASCTAQPPENKSLTWFVGANHLYMAYANAAMRADKVPISFFELWEVLNLAVPGVKAGKIQCRLPVYFGLRYISQGVQETGI